MNQTFILPVGAFTLVLSVEAQEPLSKCPKVFFNSSQVYETTCDSTIKWVGHSSFSEKVIIKYQNNYKRYIPEDSVWGIHKNNGYTYRLYKGDYYRLSQLAPIFKYSKSVGKSTQSYFSIALDSPIYSYDKEHLKQHTDSVIYAFIAKENNTNIHETAIDLFIFNTQMLNYPFVGFDFYIIYYPFKRVSTGAYLAISGRQVNDTFGFSVRTPAIINAEIGWLNQYDFVQSQKFRAGLTLINGLAYSELSDKAIKERVRTSRGYRNVSKKIAENYCYLLEPGVNVSSRLFANNHDPDVFLTAKTNYRMIFGKNNFGSQGRFSGFLFAIGLSLIGFDKELF